MKTYLVELPTDEVVIGSFLADSMEDALLQAIERYQSGAEGDWEVSEVPTWPAIPSGPWRLVSEITTDPTILGCEGWDTEGQAYLVDADGYAICRIRTYHSVRLSDGAALASLLAASPTLMRALQDMEDAREHGTDLPWDTVHAAIASATRKEG